MAAVAVLSAFLQTLFDRLATPVLEKIESLLGITAELEKLPMTLAKVRAVINDAEEKQIHNEAVKIWLKDLKDVAYEMDDLVDELITKARRMLTESSSDQNGGNTLQFLFSSVTMNLYKTEIASRLNYIYNRLDKIVQEKEHLNLREFCKISPFEPSQERETTSLVDETKVVGRCKHVENIVGSLVSDEYGDTDLCVIPIVGMPGIGKTALAQLVFKDETVKSYFEIRTWVHVSEKFDVKKLIRTIIESTTEKKFELTDLNSLHVKLMKILKGKRFLLVLDDVWNESRSEWENLRMPLISGADGSKVLLTTRSQIVSRIMGTTPSYCLEGLSNEDCWSLFKQNAFLKGNSDAHPRLEAIGKEITKKLKGLPLAAKTLGGLLYSRRNEDEWKIILNSELWELPVNENNILPALRLSYDHLPAHLKQCFIYCSLLSKGSTFDKNKVVQHWMAHGYINPSTMKQRQMEDIGGDYFEDLVFRSFFQHSKFHKSEFVMHDLIHDLTQSIAAGETMVVKDGEQCTNLEVARHYSVTCHNLRSWDSESFHKLQRLRTLIVRCVCGICTSHLPHKLLLEATNLRVLDLSKSCIIDIPDSICHLKKLRLLDLSYCDIERLPDSLCELFNLETLKLNSCDKLHTLPRDMNKLINLRHLEAKRELLCTVKGIGRLSSLQGLPLFQVSNESGYGLAELEKITELRGELCIWQLENAVTVEEASKAKLKSKQQLQLLDLGWTKTRNANLVHQGNGEQVLQELQPHANLEVLIIRGYGGLNFPSWLQNPSWLTNLVRIALFDCKRCELLPPLGQLPFLRHMIIREMPKLKRLGEEFCGNGAVRGFPSLEKLRIYKMPQLEEWIGVQVGDLPCLYQLFLSECPKLKVVPHLFPTLGKLTIIRCPQLIDLLGGTPSLHLMNLRGCDERILSSAFHLQLQSLKRLQISCFSKLKSLHKGWLQHLTALENLTIRNLDELVSLEDEGFEFLVSLKYLTIENCPKLTSLLHGAIPPALEDIVVCSCHELKSLLEGVRPQDLTSVRRLQVAGCINLEHLPPGLKNFATLSELYISNCPQIRSLPQDRLPRTVKRLAITNCPLLKERCQKERGEDWQKICHIRNIRIDRQRILNNQMSSIVM